MKDVVQKLHELVWSQAQFDQIQNLVASRYTVYSDPGDAWEGQVMDHDTYLKRLMYSRNAFPDLRFQLHHCFEGEGLVAVNWSAVGHHQGHLTGINATGKRVFFHGQTIYEVIDGKVSGHWQMIDRLGFIQQFRSE